MRLFAHYYSKLQVLTLLFTIQVAFRFSQLLLSKSETEQNILKCIKNLHFVNIEFLFSYSRTNI